MLRNIDVLTLVDAYRSLFPNELETTIDVHEYLQRNVGDSRYHRKNFDGHITTSAFVVDASQREILLLEHKILKRWLQPGGHADVDDPNLHSSALREAVEETGIPVGDLQYVPTGQIQDIPFDIDSHYIPPNDRKAELGHTHHDLRYLFFYTGNRSHAYNELEATGAKWIPLSDLFTDDTFGRVALKINGLLGKAG